MQHGAHGLDAMRAAWKAKQDAEVCEYGEAIKTAPQGYHGYKTRHWFAGERQDGHIFQASSAPAKTACEIVAEIGADCRASRCDWQTTIQRPIEFSNTYAVIREEIRRRETAAGTDKVRAVTLVETDGRGDSVTVNAGSSCRTLTFYNKSAEQRHRVAPRLMRVELRTRKEQARGTFETFRKCGDQRALSRSLVADMMQRVGLPCPFADIEAGLTLPTSYEQTDTERRVKWLRETVAPVVRKIEDEKVRKMLKIEFGF
jgi:hypothetical protein